MQKIIGYSSTLCVIFLIMVYCDWYYTFVMCGNEKHEPSFGFYTPYKWNYSDGVDDFIIAQSFGADKNGEHGIMHIRFLRDECDEVYFDLYVNEEKRNTKQLNIAGKKWKVIHNGKAFKIANGEGLIDILSNVDSFLVKYRNNAYEFKPGKLKTIYHNE